MIRPIPFKLLITSALAGTLWLSGCASLNGALDNFAPSMSAADLSSEAASLNAPSRWTFGPGTDQAVVDSWTEIISDGALLGLINEALANNRSLQASLESLNRSRAILEDAQSQTEPVFGLNFGPNLSSPIENFDVSERYSAGIDASWEVDLWGRIAQDIAGAEFDLAGTQSFVENARQALIAQVARAYMNAIESRLQLELTDATLAAQLETSRIVNVRYEFGSATRAEQVLSDSDVASARDNLAVAKAALRADIRALQVLLGRYPDGSLDIPQSFPSVERVTFAGQPADILRRRPDILTAEYDVRAAFANENVTRARTWPSLSLSGGFDTGAANFGDLFDPANLALSLGARLADELFDRGDDEPLVVAAEASSRQALRNYGQSVLDAYADVEDALDTLRLLDERYSYVNEAAQAARETLRLAEIQYKAGSTELLDVLTFRQRSFQSDRTRISIERQQLDARIALYLALGGGTPPQ